MDQGQHTKHAAEHDDENNVRGRKVGGTSGGGRSVYVTKVNTTSKQHSVARHTSVKTMHKKVGKAEPVVVLCDAVVLLRKHPVQITWHGLVRSMAVEVQVRSLTDDMRWQPMRRRERRRILRLQSACVHRRPVLKKSLHMKTKPSNA